MPAPLLSRWGFSCPFNARFQNILLIKIKFKVMQLHDLLKRRINPATEDTLKSIESKVAAGATSGNITSLEAIISDLLAVAATELTLELVITALGNGTQKAQIVNPDGVVVRMQVPNFGIIANLASADFYLPDNIPFLLKNDNPTDVILEVIPAGGDSYVETNFGQGWNPELIKAIKLNVDGGSLLWGF